MTEGYDFIVERDGKPFLDPENEGRAVPLVQVFEHYEARSLNASGVAETVGVDESDVRRGISYWRSDPEVYTELEDSLTGYSAGDVIKGTSEAVNEGLDNSVETPEPESGSAEETSELQNPLEYAEKVFTELLEDEETFVTEENILEDPEKDYIAENVDEIQLKWKRNGSDLGVYAGWNPDMGAETGFVAYSVDDEKGRVLRVEKDSMDEMVQEMYRNAIFGSL